MLPLISVIVPTRDRHERLAVTLAALRRQDLPSSAYELIVVDDGSQPPVTLPADPDGPACRLLRLDGRERSVARNRGASMARGELLVFVDDDMTVGPDFLAAYATASCEWPGALLVGSSPLPPDLLDSPYGRFRQRLEGDGTAAARGLMTTGHACAANNMAIPRQHFLQLGGFDNAIVSGEDQDLAVRHAASGGQIAFVPEAVAIHCVKEHDIRSYCRRMEWGAEFLIPFCQRYPQMLANRERHRINGPWRARAWKQLLRGLGKAAVALPAVTTPLFGVAHVLERVAPHSAALERIYRLLLGAHIYRGYRRGLQRFAQEPAPFLAPAPHGAAA